MLLSYIIILFFGVTLCKEEHESKRLILNDPDVMLNELKSLKTRMAAIEASNTKLQDTVGKLQTSGRGAIYTRWGKENCISNGTELVYTGFGGGSSYLDYGTATNFLCMPKDPSWGHYNDARDPYRGHVWGMEYEWIEFDKSLHDEDAPCAVCRAEMATSILMIPGRDTCYPGWKREYHGYLVSSRDDHHASEEYICLDSSPDVLYGGHPNENGAILYSVESVCGSLPCPPYVDGRELTCVVCSK